MFMSKRLRVGELRKMPAEVKMTSERVFVSLPRTTIIDPSLLVLAVVSRPQFRQFPVSLPNRSSVRAEDSCFDPFRIQDRCFVLFTRT
jgi:hypothetical protein